MGTSPERTERLKELVTEALERRNDVDGFEFRDSAEIGVMVAADEATETVLYHVTLEVLPDGTEETHWVTIGPVV